MGDSTDDQSDDLDEVEVKLICLAKQAERKIEKARKTSSRFCCGYLAGKSSSGQINILDLIELNLLLFENVDLSLPLPDSIHTELAGIRASFPVGVEFLGVFITQPENGNIEVAEHLLKILKLLEDIGHVVSFLVCLIKPSSLTWLSLNGNEVSEQMFEVVNAENDNIMKDYQIFRLHNYVNINWIVSSGENGFQTENDHQMVKQKLSFLIDENFLLAFDDDSGFISLEGTCKDLIDIINAKSSDEDKKDKIKEKILNVTCATQSSQPSKKFSEINKENHEESENPEHMRKVNAPVLFTQKVAGEVIKVKLHINALVIASLETTALELVYMFRDAVYRQHNALSMLIKSNHCKTIFEPVHFLPEGTSIPITALLPKVDIEGKAVLEDQFKSYRSTLHQRFLIPNNRPLLRKCVSMFSDRKTYHLINPHESVTIPNIEGAQLALVQGKYAYHHYMQDNFDDNIWGCAYRSLQTLASWFWYQGYTDKKYPTHREIQEALVEIGDKEKSFIGSNEWIGSMEVSYCLDHLYEFTSKTLHVSTGADMAYKGREIYQHFIEQGTPIMIGGGVLAHTIVGVLYNEQTGNIRFLIVDPHYTGQDNLKSITTKGWVGWKTSDFWNKTAHYNMCMPQRPDLI